MQSSTSSSNPNQQTIPDKSFLQERFRFVLSDRMINTVIIPMITPIPSQVDSEFEKCMAGHNDLNDRLIFCWDKAQAQVKDRSSANKETR